MTLAEFCEWMHARGIFIHIDNPRQATVAHAAADIVRIDLVLDTGETVQTMPKLLGDLGKPL